MKIDYADTLAKIENVEVDLVRRGEGLTPIRRVKISELPSDVYDIHINYHGKKPTTVVVGLDEKGVREYLIRAMQCGEAISSLFLADLTDRGAD